MGYKKELLKTETDTILHFHDITVSSKSSDYEKSYARLAKVLSIPWSKWASKETDVNILLLASTNLFTNMLVSSIGVIACDKDKRNKLIDALILFITEDLKRVKIDGL